MTLFRSLLFALVFYAGSLVAVLAALPASLRNGDGVRAHAVRWARFHRWCCRHILDIESRIEGTVPQGAVLVAAKHQSMYETIEMVLILHEPAIVLKRELADLPLWGRIARKYGAIPVTREGSASALRAMLRAAKDAIRQNRPTLIFPEGTRVAPGEQPPLKSGFAGLYRQLGLPVVPVAIDSGLLCPRHGFLKRPGIITFRFGDTVPPDLSRAEAEARVHADMNALDRVPQ
jgi:1-acyl-sn-glycerol-3-phosphate acyltransferase